MSEGTVTAEVVAATRAAVADAGLGSLRIDDLRLADVDGLGWSGGRPHLASMRDQLGRAGEGLVDYLAVRSPDGTVVGKGGVDYEAEPDVGTIWQLAVHPDLQGLGIGSALIEEAERCIRLRGLRTAGLSVEVDNPRAQALYERLGYVADGRRTSSWTQLHPDGHEYEHVADLIDLHKPLA